MTKLLFLFSFQLFLLVFTQGLPNFEDAGGVDTPIYFMGERIPESFYAKDFNPEFRNGLNFVVEFLPKSLIWQDAFEITSDFDGVFDVVISGTIPDGRVKNFIVRLEPYETRRFDAVMLSSYKRIQFMAMYSFMVQISRQQTVEQLLIPEEPILRPTQGGFNMAISNCQKFQEFFGIKIKSPDGSSINAYAIEEFFEVTTDELTLSIHYPLVGQEFHKPDSSNIQKCTELNNESDLLYYTKAAAVYCPPGNPSCTGQAIRKHKWFNFHSFTNGGSGLNAYAECYYPLSGPQTCLDGSGKPIRFNLTRNGY